MQNNLGKFFTISTLLLKSQVASLDFAVNRFFMKLFNTSDIELVKIAFG